MAGDFTTKTTISNSTISGNTANGDGGGVFNAFGLTEISYSTITNNTAPNGQGSGVASWGDTVTRTEVLSSIISDNTNTDVGFVNDTNSFVSEGYNLIGDGNATGAFNQTGDKTGVTDPGLKRLALHSPGSTKTHALKPRHKRHPYGDQWLLHHHHHGPDGHQEAQGENCDVGSYENKSPKVKGVSPKEGATGVRVDARVRAFFS